MRLRVSLCVCVGGGGGGRHKAGGGAPLSGEGGGICPKCPPYGDATEAPYRNQLLEGLRPTLELNTFYRWPGVSCSPLPQGLQQTLLPLQLKLKGLAVRQRRCPGQRASQGGSNSATVYRQVVHDCEWSGKSQRQLQLGQKHAHGEGSALKCPWVHYGVIQHHPHICMLKRGVQEGPDCGQGRRHTESPRRYLGPATT